MDSTGGLQAQNGRRDDFVAWLSRPPRPGMWNKSCWHRETGAHTIGTPYECMVMAWPGWKGESSKPGGPFMADGSVIIAICKTKGASKVVRIEWDHVCSVRSYRNDELCCLCVQCVLLWPSCHAEPFDAVYFACNSSYIHVSHVFLDASSCPFHVTFTLPPYLAGASISTYARRMVVSLTRPSGVLVLQMTCGVIPSLTLAPRACNWSSMLASDGSFGTITALSNG